MSGSTKTFVGITSTALVIVAFVAAIRVLVATPLSDGASLAVGATAIAVLLKILLGYSASKDFDFHNHGYDLCIMTLGTSLTAGASLYAYDLNKVKSFILLIVIAFLMALFFTLMAAINLKEINEFVKAHPGKRAPALRTLANMFLGVVSLGFNLLIVVTKSDLTK